MTRRSVRAWAALLSGAAIGLSAQGESLKPLEVNGVPLGAKMAELKGKMPAFACEQTSCTIDVSQHAEKSCGQPSLPTWSQCVSKERESLKFGSSNPIYYEAEFRGDALGRVFIRIGQGGVDGVITALIEKYGAPTFDVATPLRSRTGETFETRTVTWRRPDGKIFVKKPYGNLDEGAVIFSSKAYEDTVAQESAERVRVPPR